MGDQHREGAAELLRKYGLIADTDVLVGYDIVIPLGPFVDPVAAAAEKPSP